MEKKLCIFTGFILPHLGGVERYTDKLVDQLEKMGYFITIVTTNFDNDKNYYIKQEKHEIYKLPVYSLFKSRYPLLKKNNIYRKIIKELKSKKFNGYICQTRFYLTSQLGAKISFHNRKEPIIIEHGSSHFTVNNKVLDYFGEKYEHYLTHKLKKYHPHFYGVSNRCNEWLKHFKIQADGVFYNSVDSNVYNKYKNTYYDTNSRNNIIISYVGRIIKEKGILMLLEAFSELNKKYNNIILYIAGDGPLLKECQEKYSDSKIKFLGKIEYEDVMKLCSQTDIFVHPSMYPEGLPTSILEAGIMKTAIIATDRGGTVEVINDKKYGLIMEENKESLLEKLELLLNDNEKIEKLKNNIHNRITKEFTWEVTAKKLVKEMEKLNEKN